MTLNVVVPRCAVLLAAYNGIKWIDEQILSILGQRNVSVTIFISVDLSTDDTYAYLEEKYASFNNVILLSYGNYFGGAGKNFFFLLRNVYFSSFDVVAFSDQDDIWFDDKLHIGSQKLIDYDFYSSNVTAFWVDGRDCLIDKAQPQVQYDFIFEAAGPGCTYIMRTEAALDFQRFIFEKQDKVNKIVLHDWLLYAFARSNKYSWFIDKAPSMLYRQHENNQVGANNSFSAARKRLILIKNKWYRTEVLKLVSLFNLEKFKIVKYGLLNGYLGNLYLILHVRQLRRRVRDQFALALILLLNLF